MFDDVKRIDVISNALPYRTLRLPLKIINTSEDPILILNSKFEIKFEAWKDHVHGTLDWALVPFGKPLWITGTGGFQQSETRFSLELPLNIHMTKQIEEMRKGADLHLEIKAHLIMLSHHKGNITDQDIQNVVLSEKAVIPRNVWYQNLKWLGFLEIRNLEIRLPTTPDRSTFEQALSHISEAQKRYCQWDSRGAVDTCRLVLDDVVKAFDLNEFPTSGDKIGKLTDALIQVFNSTRKGQEFRKLLSSLYGFYSLAHHSRPEERETKKPIKWDHCDAEFAVMLAQIVTWFVANAISTSKEKA